MTDRLTRMIAFAVTIKVGKEYLFHGPSPIVRVTDKRVWIEVNYADEYPQNLFVMVTDGTDNEYDEDGNKIISVPIEYCTFHTAEEYNTICCRIDADERMLANAY